jgi:demethylmenaquinone methyltransferase/2-methoxy-6-polyprenyl-1,4-benzoquinol methylase
MVANMAGDEGQEGAAVAAGADFDFGFRRVAADEKSRLVRGVFDSVAGRYDLMNDIMSVGVHRLWKAAMIDELAPLAGLRLVDVAGGTGDIARRVLARLADPAGTVPADQPPITVCDVTREMIAAGRDRALDRGVVDGLQWVCGDAEALPIPDMSMDAYTIAFGLRNVTRIEAALAEAHRVLKPGGRFLCLEFSRVTWPLLDALYERYSFAVLPAIGRAVVGDADSYRYLAESIRRFPPQEDLARAMEAAGLERATWRDLSGGIAALHSGWRL